MLKPYTVAFFGHRHIVISPKHEAAIQKIIRELISEKSYVEFLVGRNGDFDIFAASAVRTAKKECRDDNSSLILILPYLTADFKNNEKAFLEYYDEVEICADSEKAYFKSAIKIRNREMVERSDCIICFIDCNKGGAYAAIEYAQVLGKKIINLANLIQI